MNFVYSVILLSVITAALLAWMILRGFSTRVMVLLAVALASLVIVASLGLARPGMNNRFSPSLLNAAEDGTLFRILLVLLVVLLGLSLVSIVCLWIVNMRHQRRGVALEHEKKRLETLVDYIDGIVWECDSESLRFSYVSRKAARILGYPAEDWTDSSNFRAQIIHPDDRWALNHCRKMAHERKPYEFEYRVLAKGGGLMWLRETGYVIEDATGRPVMIRGVLQDVSKQKQTGEELERLNQSLIETSRHAGMAEVATSVLHNVGNLLNSIGVSATLVANQVKGSKVANLKQAVGMLRDQGDRLAMFLTEDPKGRLIPEYLGNVTEQMIQNHDEIIRELSSLCGHIEHVKEIVSLQQGLATTSGMYEFIHPAELADVALQMMADETVRNRIRCVREYCVLPPRVKVDRHKVLQILVNLIRNAVQAIEISNSLDKTIALRVEVVSGGKMVAIRVRDTGVGISPTHLSEIFRHGFTTKKGGHGFGLHGSANFATEMGGSLEVKSEGLGSGAEFILKLPTE
jgi:PAS domain S-box-containing protein